MRKIGCLAALAALSIAQSIDARVTRFVVEERVALAPGMEWGTAGAYERLKGTAYMEVDPRDPLNAVIVNLNRAPRNARGMVEFSSPFLILKPVDMSRGNHKLWYGINNRGNCIEVGNLRAFPRGRLYLQPTYSRRCRREQRPFATGYATVDAGWHGDGVRTQPAVPELPGCHAPRRQPDRRPPADRVELPNGHPPSLSPWCPVTSPRKPPTRTLPIRH